MPQVPLSEQPETQFPADDTPKAPSSPARRGQQSAGAECPLRPPLLRSRPARMHTGTYEEGQPRLSSLAAPQPVSGASGSCGTVPSTRRGKETGSLPLLRGMGGRVRDPVKATSWVLLSTPLNMPPLPAPRSCQEGPAEIKLRRWGRPAVSRPPAGLGGPHSVNITSRHLRPPPCPGATGPASPSVESEESL